MEKRKKRDEKKRSVVVILAASTIIYLWSIRGIRISVVVSQSSTN